MIDDYNNDDKWNRWYAGVTIADPQAYGETSTYELGCAWLSGCDTVEDWGCGKGGFKMVATDMEAQFSIIGIDGSDTPFAAVKADLAHYVSGPRPDGIFMRHVIEHDYRWQDILHNVCSSATRRVCLILFTPLQHPSAGTHEIAWNPDPGVPDIGFDPAEIVAFFERYGWDGEYATYRTNTQYGEETVFMFKRATDAATS